MEIVSLNKKPVKNRSKEFKTPVFPSDFSVEKNGGKVTISEEYFEYLQDLAEFYKNLHLSSLEAIQRIME